ncbi:MAG: hypothetical protein P1U70_09485 [Saprospiraceae bacterium]|nr:hypothetical protein [Saprospiraceae bacterium]
MKKLILFIFIFTISNTIFAGGPWPQPKGKGYFKLSEWWVVFDQHFTDAGKIDPNVTTGIFNTTLYAEYGFTDRLTGILNAPFFSRNYMNNLVSNTTKDVLVEGEAINSIGDFDLGLKFGLTQPGARIPISASLILGLPTGKDTGGTLNNLQTGDGEFNQILQVDAGLGFNVGKLPAYASGYVGINNRSNGFSEEFRFGVEAGVNLLDKKLWLIGRLNAVESFKNGDTAETTTSTSIFANNTEFTGIAVEAAYYITKKWGVSASVAGAVRGEIIAAAPSYSVGVFYDLK